MDGHRRLVFSRPHFTGKAGKLSGRRRLSNACFPSPQLPTASAQCPATARDENPRATYYQAGNLADSGRAEDSHLPRLFRVCCRLFPCLRSKPISKANWNHSHAARNDAPRSPHDYPEICRALPSPRPFNPSSEAGIGKPRMDPAEPSAADAATTPALASAGGEGRLGWGFPSPQPGTQVRKMCPPCPAHLSTTSPVFTPSGRGRRSDSPILGPECANSCHCSTDESTGEARWISFPFRQSAGPRGPLLLRSYPCSSVAIRGSVSAFGFKIRFPQTHASLPCRHAGFSSANAT